MYYVGTTAQALSQTNHWPPPALSQPMKRPLEDASDRAHAKRQVTLVRLPLAKLGFHPRNRGGLGVCANHVHEVGWDGASNGIKLARYDYVSVCELPEDELETVRAVNAKKCSQAKPRLAPASAVIAYVCMTKTHFVHSCKLAEQGTATLFDKQQTKFVYKGAEWEEIKKHGVLCAIYDKDLYSDIEAVDSVMQEDNLNSGIQMKEDEMALFGKVHAFMSTEAARSQQNPEEYDF